MRPLALGSIDVRDVHRKEFAAKTRRQGRLLPTLQQRLGRLIPYGTSCSRLKRTALDRGRAYTTIEVPKRRFAKW